MKSFSRHSKPLRLREFFGNHFVQWFILLTLLIHSVSWGIAVYFIRPSEIPILLRSNVYLGYDLSSLADWRYVYGILIVAVIFFVLNAFIAFLFFRQPNRFASHITLFGGLLMQCVALIAIVSIVLVNI